MCEYHQINFLKNSKIVFDVRKSDGTSVLSKKVTLNEKGCKVQGSTGIDLPDCEIDLVAPRE